MIKEESTKEIILKTMLVATIFIFQQLYFLHLFTQGLLKYYGYHNISQINILEFIIGAILITFIAICWIIILDGMFNDKKFVKKFTIFFLLWTSIFPLWSIIILSNVYFNLISLLVIFVIILVLYIDQIKKVEIKKNSILFKLKKELDIITTNINNYRSHKHH